MKLYYSPGACSLVVRIIINEIGLESEFESVNLMHNTYLLGEHFTLPDAYLFVMLRWADFFKFDLKEWSNLTRYLAELNDRPSIQKSLREE